MRICYHCMQQISNEKANYCPRCGKSLDAKRKSERFLTPGTVLGGKYLVGDPLGAGGFGNTYIGWDSLLFRKVAIKEFYPEQYCVRQEDKSTVSVTDEKLLDRFIRGRREFLEEARKVAALHEVQGVVEISNFFEENNTGYIVMEYLEGMDLKTVLEKSGNKKDYEWSRRAILAVLYTLREIHRRGVLHRDIAPDNVFVTKEGIIKLIDFGAAKYVSAENTTDIMLKTGYAPIEQYGRKIEQGPYTDIYAAAALFYRMLTGQKPIPAKERQEKDGLIPPSEMGVSLPEQAENAIMVCLNVMPQYRLQSADEFMEALDGKYFTPIYEPEWILPTVEENNGFLKKVSGLPAAAKAAVCFCGILLVGTIIFGTAALVSNAGKAADLTEAGTDGIFAMEDYSGQSYEDVAARLERMGFLKVVEPEYVLDGKPEGIILHQNIEPSGSVSKEEEIRFTVSGGDRYYTMPDFTGSREEDIIHYFTEKNFDVEVDDNPCDDKKDVYMIAGENDGLSKKEGKIFVEKCFSEDFRSGICFAQSFEPDETCDVDEEVIISVSVGGESEDFDLTVPDFTGMTPNEAEGLLKSSGLEGIVETELFCPDEENKADGVYVKRQSIEAGRIINRYRDAGEKLRLEFQGKKQDAQKKR